MGDGMTCVDCHRTDDHRIAGRGFDLRIDEGVPMRQCIECHDPAGDHDEEVRRHLDHVACQSCHIPSFARAVSTDMLRDFRATEVNERGLYEPTIQQAVERDTGLQLLERPERVLRVPRSGVARASSGQAARQHPDGKLYPFRFHRPSSRRTR